MNESRLQDKCRIFVSQHVLACATTLIGDLNDNFEAVSQMKGFDTEELEELAGRLDYKEPAEDWLRDNWTREQLVEALENEACIQCYDSETLEVLIEAYVEHMDTEGELEEFCCVNRIDPYSVDAYEHWIVDDFLAQKLEEKGEIVNRNFMGLTIWGRTITGQAICLDGVIQQIVQELNDLVIDFESVGWKLRSLRDYLKASETVMNDPKRNGSGDEARPPTGEDWNNLRRYVENILVYIFI